MIGGRSCIAAATILGVEAVPVDVEVDVGAGLPCFCIVGLPDLAVQEARERVRSAIRATGFDFPNARVIVNLAPAPLRKHGTGFDLPIALAILAATGQIDPGWTSGVVAVGELSLDGTVRGVAGLIAHALGAKNRDLTLLAPPGAGVSGGLADGRWRPITQLSQVKGRFEDARGESGPLQAAPPCSSAIPDLSEVFGHELALRALALCAAGGHNLLMIGPPGSGKTMIARRLPGILPPLTDTERLETALVQSVGGADAGLAMSGQRPFRAPHHSASVAGLVGGGSPPRPGEISMAHNGVLFLDELPEFGPAALQTLRQPLEDGIVTLVRAEGRLTFPARFTLVAAANPCPCGFFGDPERSCTCPESVRGRYLNRVGGPLLDRIDLAVRVDRVNPSRIIQATPSTKSADVRGQVCEVRERADRRALSKGRATSGAALLASCALGREESAAVESLARSFLLSGRGVTRLLRVARTLADWDCADRVRTEHLEEAAGYRIEGVLG